MQNVVNTTSVNSQIVYQTINIFVNSDQTIDLSAPITVATNVASASNAADSADVVMNNTNNYAVVNNAIVSAADSGNNTGSGSGQFVVNTGNAYSLVNLLNTVNVTLTNSVIHIITINIYGTLNGNIVLPQLGGNTTYTSCSITLSTQNSAAVTNTVNSQAVTGQNTLTATTGDNSIVTGDAQNATDITNLINLILLNEMTGHLYINNLGEWDGQFLGWDGSTATQLGNTLALDNTPTITGSNNQSSQENINNSANVNNNIQSSANTGGNTINGSNGRITTGSAYNAVAITNLINAIFSHSYGFFGFVNIFGTLHGNIGGQTSLLHLSQHQLLLPKLLLRPTPKRMGEHLVSLLTTT